VQVARDSESALLIIQLRAQQVNTAQQPQSLLLKPSIETQIRHDHKMTMEPKIYHKLITHDQQCGMKSWTHSE
jgi:hypothetical protein